MTSTTQNGPWKGLPALGPSLGDDAMSSAGRSPPCGRGGGVGCSTGPKRHTDLQLEPPSLDLALVRALSWLPGRTRPLPRVHDRVVDSTWTCGLHCSHGPLTVQDRARKGKDREAGWDPQILGGACMRGTTWGSQSCWEE